ncbi:MAG: DUF4232 domain-containing protein [Kutzneria sp.]|nr:DUF4232 domain-containing protein [Kutzneria sp.]
MAAALTAGCSNGGNAGSSASTAARSTISSTTTAVSSSGSPAAGSGPAQPGGASKCKAAGLRLDLKPTDGGMGKASQLMVFTNVSKYSCTIAGFPGVSYVTGDNGSQVGAPAQHNGTETPQVTLAPGQAASSRIDMQEVEAVPQGTDCRPTALRGLRVYPPDDTAAMFVSLPPLASGDQRQGCANPAIDQLAVAPVTSG